MCAGGSDGVGVNAEVWYEQPNTSIQPIQRNRAAPGWLKWPARPKTYFVTEDLIPSLPLLRLTGPTLAITGLYFSSLSFSRTIEEIPNVAGYPRKNQHY
jgi:hypothetical protein